MSATAIRRKKLRSSAERVLTPAARALGYDLSRHSFYSPLPDREQLPVELWDEPNPMLGVRFELEEQFEFLEQQLRQYVPAFTARCEDPVSGFELWNGTYESVDAETLYAMVRYARPRQVVEVGSGSSSHVIAMALQDNTEESRYRVFDPYPWAASRLQARSDVEVTAQGACDIPVSEFESLSENDILFIDTTHTVKTGGEVTHLFLNILPRLAPGVLVHVHDIFLPWEYRREWVLEQQRAFAEQYLLQAFLAFNEDFEVLLATHALARSNPRRVHRTIPSFRPGVAPGAFWFTRI
jgi:predicted O-methyltransferase YrrM